MDIIYVDTSIFENENFTEGSKMKQLIELGQNSIVQIIIPQIVYEEVKARIVKTLTKIRPEYKKMYNEFRILRNDETYKLLFKSSELNVKDETKIIVGNFEEMIKKGKVEILPYPTLNISKVFDNYFNNKPPFKEGEKKHEFPDAFAMATVEKWCSENDKKCLVFCKDNDILDYQSNYLTPIKDFKEYINKKVIELQKQQQHQDRLDIIERVYNKDFDNFKNNELQSVLEDIFNDYFRNEYDNLLLDSIELSVQVNDNKPSYAINFINEIEADIEIEIEADIEIEIEATIKAHVIYDDYNTALYDKEDNVWHFNNVVPKTINETIKLPISIVVELNPPAGKDFAHLKLKSINDGRKIKI